MRGDRSGAFPETWQHRRKNLHPKNCSGHAPGTSTCPPNPSAQPRDALAQSPVRLQGLGARLYHSGPRTGAFVPTWLRRTVPPHVCFGPCSPCAGTRSEPGRRFITGRTWAAPVAVFSFFSSCWHLPRVPKMQLKPMEINPEVSAWAPGSALETLGDGCAQPRGASCFPNGFGVVCVFFFPL